jgi:hypothetical protein
MRFLFLCGVVLSSGLFCGCTFYVRHIEPARYTVKILYSNEQLSGAALSGQSVLLLPILTRDGPDTTHFPTPREQSCMVGKVRDDLRFIFPQTFEKRYRDSEAGRDSGSLDRFFGNLYNGNVMAIQTSDSIWKAVDADFLIVVRIKYAATIRGFDGNASRRLIMEIELWNVAAIEAALRIEVIGFENRPGVTDVQFVMGALKEAYGALPGYLPANNETDW